MDKICDRYTTIGRARRLLVENYTKYGSRLSFIEALSVLEATNQLVDVCPEIPADFHYATTEELIEAIDTLPVETTRILNQARDPNFGEMVIPKDRDMFAFIHLPYEQGPLHRKNCFEINYVFSGKCRQVFENEVSLLGEGELCIVAPHSLRGVFVDPEDLVLNILVRKSTFTSIFWGLLTKSDLLSLFFRKTLYDAPQSNYLIFKTDNGDEIRHILQNIIFESYRNDPYANICAVSYMNLLFSKVLREFGETIHVYRFDDHLEKETNFALILQYMQLHFNDVTLGTLSKLFHYSESHMSMLFKKNLNQNFTDVLCDLKMKYAEEYLKNTKLKISEITTQVGYDSADHFSRTFRKMHGVTPLEYRKTHAVERLGS